MWVHHWPGQLSSTPGCGAFLAGFRLDVADELPDNSFEVRACRRRRMKPRKSSCWAGCGVTTASSASMKAPHLSAGWGLDSCDELPLQGCAVLVRPKTEPARLAGDQISPDTTCPMCGPARLNFLSTHDFQSVPHSNDPLSPPVCVKDALCRATADIRPDTYERPAPPPDDLRHHPAGCALHHATATGSPCTQGLPDPSARLSFRWDAHRQHPVQLFI